MDRFGKFNNAFVPKRFRIVVTLETILLDQAIDQRQTTDHDGLPGLRRISGAVIPESDHEPGFRQKNIASGSISSACGFSLSREQNFP